MPAWASNVSVSTEHQASPHIAWWSINNGRMSAKPEQKECVHADCDWLEAKHHYMLPKRRFWKTEQKMKYRCSTHFFKGSWPKMSTHSHPRKLCRTSAFHLLFRLYPSQTKILEGRTNLSECVFEALFKGVSTSRRQLIPLFDKPAFSRFSQLFQPRIKVHIFGEIVKRQVCQKGG